MFTSFAVLSRDRAYVAYAINGAFVASTFFVYMTTAPFVYVGLLGLSATGYALYYMTTVGGFLVGYVIAGRAAAAHVAIDRALSVATLFCFAAAVAGLAVAIVLPWSVWSLTLPVILLTVCSGVVTPNNQAAIVSGDARIVGAASGLAGFVQMMVGGVLIQLVGVLPHATPYPMTGAMVVSAGIGAAAILWRGPPRPRDDGGTQVP
jgi:DHA1 family bicyclomycin/chloramphenicol resistance-like MFS transporter